MSEEEYSLDVPPLKNHRGVLGLAAAIKKRPASTLDGRPNERLEQGFKKIAQEGLAEHLAAGWLQRAVAAGRGADW